MRAATQLLTGSELEPADVVQRATALQGQDLPAVLRAIALRSRSSVAQVRAAFDAGLIVRSWPMRGTLFATTPAHLFALLHHTAARVRRATVRRRAELGIDERVIGRARDVLAEALAEGPQARAEVLDRWQRAGIATADGRGYHLLMHLCVAGLAWWGRFAEGGSEQLLELATPPDQDLDAGLVEVVRGFVRARGPVTEADLAWWTKLPLGQVRPILRSAPGLVEVTVRGAPAWVLGEPNLTARATGVILVPAFDEWVLGYTDRSLVASRAMQTAMVPGGNGMFRPVVLVDGVVVGTWRPRRGSAAASFELVEKVSAANTRRIERAVAGWPHD